MSITRALVVDDSRSARAALKKLLEEYELQVSTAQSGEDALEFLARESVDVIFMDHTMPGMDGLEAVSAIKANPKTATIPVMMYTTREGEVYVGQARALGAVGVLPKNVQPHQLFEMLRKLGLVTERRQTEAVSDQLTQALDDADREFEQQALGMSVQALVTRILEDQHLTLRSDILRSQKTFAKQVAHEIVREQALAEQRSNLDVEADVEWRAPSRWPLAAAVVLTAVLGFLAFGFKAERDQALADLVQIESSQTATIEARVANVQRRLAVAEGQSANVRDGSLQALAWALNQPRAVPMQQPAFHAELAETVEQLIQHLQRMAFAGEVRITSHLGEFCLDGDQTPLAAQELQLGLCVQFGHVLADSTYISDRLSVEFAELLRNYRSGPIWLNLVALDLDTSEQSYAYPSGGSAAQWNDVARLNNRVHIEFFPKPETLLSRR